VGSVLPAQSFSFGSSPLFAQRSKSETASLCALTCIGSYCPAKSSGFVSRSLSSFFYELSFKVVGNADFISAGTMPFSSLLVLV
jgi:hypothetical protein